MNGGQITALIFAILLFFPGGCFLIVSLGLFSENHQGDVAFGLVALGIAAALFALVGFLGWVAFRKPPPPPPLTGGPA